MSSIYYKNQKYTGPTLDLGSGSLTTDDKTIVGAINELDASRQLRIKVKEVSIPTITIGTNGYTSVYSYKPEGMANFLFCFAKSFGVVSPTGAFNITSNGGYVVGAANTTITNLVLSYYYTD